MAAHARYSLGAARNLRERGIRGDTDRNIEVKYFIVTFSAKHLDVMKRRAGRGVH